ncbi:DNA primase [Paraburkholderia sp. BR13444]|uniref:DNA primase n=1 Tax=Paraburkholderia sp. BR13444 TaxID=3236997 RepID=UPI0034CD6576
MTVAALLDKLEGVRGCGSGRWRARCPVCESHKAVLALTETAEGTVLLHCFRNGCAVADIAAAVGVDLADLFPPHVDGVHASKPIRRRFNAVQVLGAINLELLEVLLIAGAILQRGSITLTEHERLRLAVSRVSVAEGASRG